MKIAIIGAGFSGISAAWHLINQGAQVTIFDQAGIGGGTSGMAAGLLHTYAGLHSKLNWMGSEGYQAACSQLRIASEALQEPVFKNSGLLRIAMTDSMQQDFAACADQFEDVEWWEAKDCQQAIPGLVAKPGIFIKSALTVYSELYIKGLFLACSKKGVQLQKLAIARLDQLKDFDRILIAAGAQVGDLEELPALPFTQVKGQILEVEWPSEIPPLAIPLNSQAYILMNPHQKTCAIGATYERNFTSPEPNEQVASQEIMPKAIALIPALKSAKILRCKAGIRSSTPDHRPLIEKINDKCWILSGMGSKGLLYHALFGELIAQKILHH